MSDVSPVLQLLASVLCLGVLFGFTAGSLWLMDRFSQRRQFKIARTLYLKRMVRYGALALGAILLSIIWGVNLAGLWFVVSSLFGIIGIAFFAQWSLLSNVTTSFVLFFSAPFKIEDRITLKDGDNSVTGVVSDMTLFYVRILSVDGESVNIPNNLVLQKSVVRHAAPAPDGAADDEGSEL